VKPITKTRLLILFALIGLCNSGSAQFFALEFDSINPFVAALPYPADGKYRVVAFDHRFQSNPGNRVRIKVYDQNFQFEKTILLLKGITIVNDYPPIHHNGRLIWPSNYCDTVNGANNWLAVLELDTNYNFLALHKLSSHSFLTRPTGIIAHQSGYVVGEYLDNQPDSVSAVKTKLFTLNLSLAKTDSALFNDELRLRSHISINNEFVCAADNLKPVCTTSSQVTQKITLDSDLAVIDCMDLPVSMVSFCYDGGGNMIASDAERIRQKGIILPISTVRDYAQGGADRLNCPQFDQIWMITSMTLKGGVIEQRFDNAHLPEQTNFPLYYSSNFDYKGRNTIYVGSVGRKNNPSPDKPFFPPYYEKEKTRMTIVKSDTAGNFLWKREYGGDMNYFGRSVAFTADGGCLIAGTRYDSASMFNNGVFENFLLKLNKNGDIFVAGISEQDTEHLRSYHHPNPVTTTAIFDFPEKNEVTLSFMNSTGEVILTKKSYRPGSWLDLGELQPGIYTYQAVSFREVYSGKLLKLAF
jgi:hypothetical protein